MTVPKWFRATALPLVVAACATVQTPVPVIGLAGEVGALTGEWVGEYSSAASGRSGSITFTLRAAGDTAFGDVVMIPAGWGRPLAPWQQHPSPQGVSAPIPQPEVLTISFVRVKEGRVSGTLAPYTDPETGERLLTTFAGALRGDTIEGTYLTRLPSGATQTGSWRVERR